MEFIQVKPTINSSMVNKCLKSSIPNDVVFDDSKLILEFKLKTSREYVELIYRKMYERMYLRWLSSPSSILNSHYETVEIFISISEAINYIMQVTPPIFRNRAKTEITSIDKICEMLEMYLSVNDNNSNSEYNMSLFKRIIHMEIYETKWPYKNTGERIEFIRDNYCQNKKCPIIGVIDVALKPIEDIDVGSVVQVAMYTKDMSIKNMIRLFNIFGRCLDGSAILCVYYESNQLFIEYYAHANDVLVMWIKIWYKEYLASLKSDK